MEIKQTWNKIQVNGMSENHTSTTSESASVLEQHGQMYFSYSYWIHHLGGQYYPGFNSLRVEENKLIGQYFSAKDVTGEFMNGYKCVKKKSKGKRIAELTRGCGSKGIIVFTKN